MPSATTSQLTTCDIRVLGQRFRVAIRPGDGTRTPLLLMNGIGVGLELLRPLVDALDPAIEVIRFDAPGVGGSPTPPLPYRFPALAYLVERLLDQLGYERVDALGVSWGGALAQQFARQYPQRCRRLVLAATSTGAIMVPGRPSALSKMITPRRYLSPTFMQKAAGAIYGGEARRNPQLMSAHTSRIIAPQFMGYLYQLFAGMGWTSIHWLHRIRQPTLVMAGSDDPLVPPVNARIISLLIPNNRLFIVPGGGHLFMLYSLDKVVPEVRGFLDSASPAAG